jgi:general secretion pathway protein G
MDSDIFDHDLYQHCNAVQTCGHRPSPQNIAKPISKNQDGFTLIELLVSLAIMAVLATLAVPIAQIARQRVQEQDLRFALREIRQGIDAYKRASDEGRIAKQVVDSGYPPDLEVLVAGVVDQRDPRRNKLFFLRRIPRDPTNSNPDTQSSVSWGKRSYASEVDNPSEGADVYDVYSLTEKTGLNGVPYKKW